MGCVYSQPRRSRSSANSSNADNPRIFHVCNVDDRGTEVNFGKIEITDNELALHQKGRNSIYWSLRSLRRYGFDAELFSFECGRRCPTGPGIYAFKCANAEQLFNALQEAIQQCTSTSQYPLFGAAADPTTPPEVGPRYPVRASAATTGTAAPAHHFSSDANHEYINSPFYVNTSVAAQSHNASSQPLPTARSDVNTNYAKLDDLVRFYVNIKTPVVNQSLPPNGALQSTDSACSPPHSPATPSGVEPVNYILLDLDQSQSTGQPTVVTTAPPTPVSKTPTMEWTALTAAATPPTTPTGPSPPMPYAQIDFAKTVALRTVGQSTRDFAKAPASGEK